jgi:hypothetical protein
MSGYYPAPTGPIGSKQKLPLSIDFAVYNSTVSVAIKIIIIQIIDFSERIFGLKV